MFRSVKLKNIYVTVFSLLCVAVFLVVSVLMLRAGAPEKVSVWGEEYSLRAENDDDKTAFLSVCGFDRAELYVKRDVIVPEKWNDIYESYQELQKAQGLDLVPYKGKEAEESAFLCADDTMAYLLVSGGRIIAAHVCRCDGTDMRPLIN